MAWKGSNDGCECEYCGNQGEKDKCWALQKSVPEDTVREFIAWLTLNDYFICERVAVGHPYEKVNDVNELIAQWKKWLQERKAQ